MKFKRNKTYPLILLAIGLLFLYAGSTNTLLKIIQPLVSISFSILSVSYALYGLFKPYATIDSMDILYIYKNPLRTETWNLNHYVDIIIEQHKVFLVDELKQQYSIDITNVLLDDRKKMIEKLQSIISRNINYHDR